MRNRNDYLKKAVAFQGKTNLIKVVTGIRRCGKSSLLKLLREHLLEQGVAGSSIIYMNFESLEYDFIQNYRDLDNYILSKKPDTGIVYLLLDEVQQVENWEKAVNSLRLDGTLDIYITGSNAYLLSSELSTLLSGRYVEIEMYPLSFREYLDFVGYYDEPRKISDRKALFEQYIRYGGLPETVGFDGNEETIGAYLMGVYHTIVVKDVVAFNTIKDVDLLEKILLYVADNIGNHISSNKISNFLTSTGRKTSRDTIDSYLNMLEKAFILYRTGRFDLKGKQLLATQGKYYFSDVGIRNKLLLRQGADIGRILENVVFLELLKRGFAVTIGKFDALEIDFVAEKSDERIYYQVTLSMLDEAVRERELRPFKKIDDNYEKVVLTLDEISTGDFDGIKNVNLIDFLLE
jgi:predicted AAA+ superfamily ATPase